MKWAPSWVAATSQGRPAFTLSVWAFPGSSGGVVMGRGCGGAHSPFWSFSRGRRNTYRSSGDRERWGAGGGCFLPCPGFSPPSLVLHREAQGAMGSRTALRGSPRQSGRLEGAKSAGGNHGRFLALSRPGALNSHSRHKGLRLLTGAAGSEPGARRRKEGELTLPSRSGLHGRSPDIRAHTRWHAWLGACVCVYVYG